MRIPSWSTTAGKYLHQVYSEVCKEDSPPLKTILRKVGGEGRGGIARWFAPLLSLGSSGEAFQQGGVWSPYSWLNATFEMVVDRTFCKEFFPLTRLEMSKATGAPRSVLLSVVLLGEEQAESPWVQRGSASCAAVVPPEPLVFPTLVLWMKVRKEGYWTWAELIEKPWLISGPEQCS